MTGPAPAAAWPIPLDDPYPALAELRARGAVHLLPEFDVHVVVGNAVATDVLQGPDWSSDPSKSPRLAARFGMTDVVARSVLFSDAPDHVRLRRSLRGCLGPRSVEAMRPRIRAIVQAAWSDYDPQEPFDVMEELAYPVPLAIICELFGAPPDIACVLREETPRMADMLDPLADARTIEAGTAAAFGAMLAFVPLVADRRKDPAGDLLSALAQSAPDGLKVDEAIVMALLLLAAGHETTANLVGNAVVALHDRPDVVQHLRDHPELIDPAVEELLRFDSPVQLTARVATREIVLDGVEIPAGAQILVSLGAANRDPSVFADPDRLDIRRERGSSLAFGHGPHFCAGASLARCEGSEMLRSLLKLEPAFEEQELTAQRGTSVTFRRVRSARLLP